MNLYAHACMACKASILMHSSKVEIGLLYYFSNCVCAHKATAVSQDNTVVDSCIIQYYVTGSLAV